MMSFSVFITMTLVFFTLMVNSKPTSFTRDSGRIINGHDVPEGKYPFIVSLHSMDVLCDFSQSPQKYHFCGGAVINDNTILTAAHCLSGNFDHSVVLVGGHHLENMGSCYNISKVIPHPEYTDVGNTPDIGVIKLTSPIDFKKDKASKICLPEPPTNAISTGCTIMGWGATEGEGTKHLQELAVTVKKTSQYGIQDGHYKVDFDESGGSTCFGDSGGPLVCQAEGNVKSLLQFGIVSFGIGGDCKGFSAYTNVALYIDWLKQVSEE